MKIHKLLLPALIVSAGLSVSAQAGKHNGNNNNDSPSVSRPGRGDSSSSYSGAGPRSSGRPTYAPSSQRFSSYGSAMRSTHSPVFRDTSFRPRSFSSSGGAGLSQRQFTPRTFGSSNRAGLARPENNRHFQTTTQTDRFAQFQTANPAVRRDDIQSRRSDRVARVDSQRTRDLGTTRNIRENRTGSLTTDSRRRTSTDTSRHVYAQRSANWQPTWDRHRDHWWRGHRCRFVNNSWIIFDFGFTPWYGYPYDYYASDYYYGYPYGYGGGYYDNGYYGGYGDAGSYGDGSYYSSDQYADNSTVAAAQEELARLGYYRGAIDGVAGPATRRAVRRYQSDNGLRVTGYLSSETLEALGLNRVASY